MQLLNSNILKCRNWLLKQQDNFKHCELKKVTAIEVMF